MGTFTRGARILVKVIAWAVREFSIVNEVDTFLSPEWSVASPVGHPVGQSATMAMGRRSRENGLTKPLQDN